MHYTKENFVPPVCIVVPSDPYITAPVGANPFRKPYSVNMQIVVIGTKGTNEASANKLDSMLESVITALEEDWDITEVGEPKVMSIKGIAYTGSLVTLTQNTTIEMEVI